MRRGKRVAKEKRQLELATMHFEGRPPDLATLARGGWSWKLFASGQVDIAAGEKFQEFLMRHNVPRGSELYINSHGIRRFQ
jgi:hypothetical protein